ncbi:diguanylate cyclase [uncultured Azohydromonas sp.]|mgnify:CR=1 FL=1|jgi:diguanylate cyclase (GGDEF) domain|uniref:sensor domain-containing diguanylate cyclase n=1 Tax=uncultured Azohydromonas sp. TaxID=487342 RepID=UPI002611C97E|nr:diguanylate cyclase [uncultured Azohydromonas sp.]
MEQYAGFFDTLEELDLLLSAAPLRGKLGSARSVLAQVFVSRTEDDWAQAVAARVAGVDARIVVVGASTAGEICGGQVRSASNVLSLLLFHTAELHAVAYDCAPGQEAAVAARLAADLAAPAAAPLKGLLLLGTGTDLDTGLLLQALHGQAPGLPLFGGAAADSVQLGRTLVLHGQRVLDQGYVGVGLYGDDLEVLRQAYLGWEPMGKRMRATRASRFVIETIDDQPALDVYRHYLGIGDDDQLFLNAMEFPLLVERDGHLLARVPRHALPGGAIEYIGDVREGEELQFGYAHLDGIVERARGTQAAVRVFEPQAILLYSCNCRFFVMQQDVELELRPYETMAPTAGFFTYGEFCDLGHSSPLMTSTLLVVALREGPRDGVPALESDAVTTSRDVYARSHARILSRFQHFVRAIAEDLEHANRELQVLAEHDGLTGLANRRKLQSLVAVETERAQRYGQDFSVMVCDVDHFKRFNDTYGHEVGDEVLRQVAHALVRQVRGTDTVCRYGGEEFVVLLPHTGLDEALQCAERLRSAVAGLCEQPGHLLPCEVTMSFGVAGYPAHGLNEAALLAAADRALYGAKHAGRNRVCAAGLAP